MVEWQIPNLSAGSSILSLLSLSHISTNKSDTQLGCPSGYGGGFKLHCLAARVFESRPRHFFLEFIFLSFWMVKAHVFYMKWMICWWVSNQSSEDYWIIDDETLIFKRISILYRKSQLCFTLFFLHSKWHINHLPTWTSTCFIPFNKQQQRLNSSVVVAQT